MEDVSFGVSRPFNNIFTFKAEGIGVDLTGLTNPVTVVLTIGIDSGTTTATAQFQNRKA